jgi:hypothetical protein
MIFAGIYGKYGEGATTILLLLFAFQNGFFWKTVLDKTPQTGAISPKVGTTQSN